jgi:hypothetical protein
MKDKVNIYHWEFYIDHLDSDYTVYDKRQGDVIGYLPNTLSLDEIWLFLKDFTEDEVYQWIDDNIGYL